MNRFLKVLCLLVIVSFSSHAMQQETKNMLTNYATKAQNSIQAHPWITASFIGGAAVTGVAAYALKNKIQNNNKKLHTLLDNIHETISLMKAPAQENLSHKGAQENPSKDVVQEIKAIRQETKDIIQQIKNLSEAAKEKIPLQQIPVQEIPAKVGVLDLNKYSKKLPPSWNSLSNEIEKYSIGILATPIDKEGVFTEIKKAREQIGVRFQLKEMAAALYQRAANASTVQKTLVIAPVAALAGFITYMMKK